MDLSKFIKMKRKEAAMSQSELADHAGVGLRFIRDMEQGKKSLQMDKVNTVLELFGYKLAPLRSDGRDDDNA